MRRKLRYFEDEKGAPAPVGIQIRRRLRFSEVDALGIAWHGRYPVFFEEAQTELGHKVGLTYAAYREAGVAAPMVRLHVDYRKPLRLDECFTVTALLHWSEGARLNTEYRIEKENGECVCTGYTIQMFTDLRTGEALYCPPAIWEQCRERWKKGEFHA